MLLCINRADSVTNIIDQALEQVNAVVKADGGAYGVTGDSAALTRWMVTGPEIRCSITQLETTCTTKEGGLLSIPCSHHEHQVTKELKDI